MFLVKKKLSCCNPKKQQCSRVDLRAAMTHAQERADVSGRSQGTRFKDGKWIIVSK